MGWDVISFKHARQYPLLYDTTSRSLTASRVGGDTQALRATSGPHLASDSYFINPIKRQKKSVTYSITQNLQIFAAPGENTETQLV